jgi:nucleotide-binding universal stress UspA family protein
MTMRLPTVLCPIDFSDASKSALCFATAIADHFGARLTVLTVDDPLLAEVAKTTGRIPSLAAETERELRRFCSDTLAQFPAGPKTVEYLVAVGKPAIEILHAATEQHADLIVISSHGRSGVRKMFFGSTTERVLRETTVPVLITPDERPPATSLSELARHINRVVAPVDLTDASPHQISVAAGLAQALGTPLIAAHVVEPIFVPYSVRLAIPGTEAARRADAEERLSALTAASLGGAAVEAIVLTGEPSEEIIRLIEARRANLVVMGLHASGLAGPRMGSVTYRVLCTTRALVLAVPPKVTAAGTTLVPRPREHMTV